VCPNLVDISSMINQTDGVCIGAWGVGSGRQENWLRGLVLVPLIRIWPENRWCQWERGAKGESEISQRGDHKA
jgi:hypothetical protein